MNSTPRRMFILTIYAFVLSVSGLLSVSSTASAQTNVGRISGTVKDSTRAVIPGANVTVTNQATGITRTATTDEDGYYLVTNLPRGNYSVAVERDGFTRAEKRDYNLVSDGRLTIDFSLEPGGISAAVIVTSAVGETVNDTSGEVARAIDGEQVQDLATNGRNYTELLTLIPGAPLLTDDALDQMTSLGVSQPINGNRGNSNNMTVDGGFNLDSGSNGSQINNVGIDFIQEVSIKTSNFSAEYGRNSGASINVSTKSGTNRFRGSLFEYFRNEKLNANSFANNSQGIFSDDLSKPGAKVLVASNDPRNGQPRAPRRPEHYNNFGFSFGGPIKKNKLFFFGGMEWKVIRRVEAKSATLPTSAEIAGNFAFRLRGTDGIVGTADDGVIRDPLNAASTCRAPTVVNGVVTVQAIRTGCFGGTNVALRNIIPANRITPDGRAIANIYAAMAARSVFTDTPTGNNAFFQEPNPFSSSEEVIRIDYKRTDNQSLYFRYLHDDYDPLIDPYGTLIGAAMPTIPTKRERPGHSAQVSHTWLISPKLVNEFRINASWNRQRIQPIGDAWKRETYEFKFRELYGGGRFPNSIPRIRVSGTTGFAEINGAARALLAPTTEIQFSDSVSMPKGNHSLKFGGVVIRNRKDQNGRTQSAGDIEFVGDSRAGSTGIGFGDALLGNFIRYTEFNDDPLGFFRFTQIEAYAMDNWKVFPSFSLEVGARYRYNLPIYTQANNVANFDPRLYDPARAVTVIATGTGAGTVVVPTGATRFNGLVRAGDGVPESELGRVRNGRDPEVLAVPAGAPRGLYSQEHIIEPRIGFAWSPFKNRKTAVRGGFGIFHDRPEGNIIFPMLNNPPYTLSARIENGNLSDPTSGVAGALLPLADMTAIDPNLRFPYTMSYSLTVQRELPYGLFAEVGYVGNQARHLLRLPNINVPTRAQLAARLLANPQPNSAAIRPYKGYSAINMRLSDANSNYNALQVYVTKRKGNIRLTGSYTWSKVLADASANGDNPDAGEDPYNHKADYGPASFDRTHIFVATSTYRLPFFRRGNGFASSVLGGWEISSILRFQTGSPETVIVDTGIGNDRRADYTGAPLIPANRSPDQWFNIAAFARPPEDRAGTSGRGIIRGANLNRLDLALSKRFTFKERFRAQLRLDAFNALNHASWRGVNTDFNSGSFGRLDTPSSPRSIQAGLRFEF